MLNDLGVDLSGVKDEVVAGAGTFVLVPPGVRHGFANHRDTLELVFVLDTTGSMGGLIDGAKQRIWGIINEVMQKPSKPRVRVGLVAYRDLGECWYVLGNDARGRCIASPDEIPQECGVLVLEGERLVVARAAVHRAFERIPFGVWLALAKAQPIAGFDDDAQGMLGDDAP